MDDRVLLDRLAQGIREPEDVMEGLRRRRDVKRRNARVRAGAVGFLVAAIVAVFAFVTLRPEQEVSVPVAPPDPYVGTWISTDIADGSDQTMTIEPRIEGYRVVLVDEVASTSCGTQSGTLRGTASPPDEGEDLVVEWRALECGDGSRSPDPDPFVFRGDPTTGVITDGSDTAWSRAAP
jgi:hypothetical protein